MMLKCMGAYNFNVMTPPRLIFRRVKKHYSVTYNFSFKPASLTIIGYCGNHDAFVVKLGRQNDSRTFAQCW
jgi:hypothetical protein